MKLGEFRERCAKIRRALIRATVANGFIVDSPYICDNLNTYISTGNGCLATEDFHEIFKPRKTYAYGGWYPDTSIEHLDKRLNLITLFEEFVASEKLYLKY